MAFMFVYFLAFAFVSTFALAADQKVISSIPGFDAIRQALLRAGIIDEVLDDFQPKCTVLPAYGQSLHQTPVAYGNIFKQSETKHNPSVRIICPEVRHMSGLTLALTDPDAPSRKDPKWSEMCHWIALITTPPKSQQGYLEFSFDIEDAIEEKEIVPYKPPGPPPKTGYHRYVFVLLEGDNTNLTVPSDRQHWGAGKKGHGLREWANKEGLSVISANYFIEQNTEQ